MTAVLAGRINGRSLITPELFDRLAHRIATDDKLKRDLADRIVDQALAFLATCASNTGAPLAPSAPVDLGWHAFLLHTKDYATFCERIAGRFLHHVPTCAGDLPAGDEVACATLTRTLAAIEAAGFTIEEDLWSAQVAGSCTGCHNGCHDDPPPARSQRETDAPSHLG